MLEVKSEVLGVAGVGGVWHADTGQYRTRMDKVNNPYQTDVQSHLIHHDDGFMSVYWSPRTACPIVVWKKFSATGACRDAFDKMLELLQSKRVAVAMADFTKLSVLSTDDQTWIRKDWLPRAAKTGLGHLGVVLPNRTLGKMSLMKGVRFEDASRLEIAYFNEHAKTEDWLHRVSASPSGV